MEVAIILLLGLLATVVAAWVGFFIGLSMRHRVSVLEARVVSLAAGTARESQPAAPAQPVPDTAPDAPTEPSPEPAPDEPPAPPPAQPETPPAAAMPAAPPPRAAQSAPAMSLFQRIERSLGGAWLVWIAGAALALGGLFLAKAALDAGLLGPLARILLAALAGAAMLGAGEFLRRRPAGPARAAHLPAPVLSAAGLITLYGDVYAAYAAYQLMPGPVAFGLLAAIAALALFLAWLHGPVIAAFGIAGGFAAPLLIGSDSPNAAALFVYVLAVAGASLAVARFAHWRWTAWLSLAGGAGWPLLWLLGAFDPDQALALAIYLPAFAALAAAFAWSEAGAPPRMGRSWRAWLAIMPPSVLAAHAALAAALLLTLWLLSAWSYAAPGVAALGALAALAVGAAWRREGFALLPVGAAAAVSAAFYFWPHALAEASVAEVAALENSTDAAITQTPVVAAAAAFIALFGVGGYFAQGRLRLKGPMAVASAGAPVAILVVLGLVLDSLAPAWAVALFVTALIQAGVTELMARRMDEARPGPVAAYALGASGAVLGALALTLSEAWLGAAIALEAMAIAWLWRRWGTPALAWAAGLIGLVAAYRLTLGADTLVDWSGDLGNCAALLLAYAVAALALEAAARLFRAGGLARISAPVRTLEGLAVTVGVVAGSLAIRLALNGGALDAPDYSLTEMGLQVSLWLTVPLALRMRVRGELTLIQRAAEGVLIVLAAAHLLFVQLLIANPWTGVAPLDVTGPAILNPLLIAYGLPAALVAALTAVWRRRGFAMAPWAAGAATVLAFAWITLEVRRAFHAPELNIGPIGDAEGWAYSAAWLIGAGVAMALGVMRRLPILRYAALVVITATTFKVFLIDLAGLEGVWRALSFLGLGAVLMLIAVAYQRVILPADRALAGDGRAAP